MQRATYTCFYGNKLFTIKPNVHERLFELQVLEFALPEDIERLRHSRKRDLGLSEKLELTDDAVCTVNSIEIGWRPPTKNAEVGGEQKLVILYMNSSTRGPGRTTCNQREGPCTPQHHR